jgi:hypothetical protein
MPSDRSLVEREMERVELRAFTLEGFHRRRERKQRNKRIRAGVLALLVTVLGTGALLRAFPSGVVPADDPRSPFLGTWVATDPDGSTQTMTVEAQGDDAVEIESHDDAASVCSGASSTTVGTGRLEGSTELVIGSPVLTCDDGSEPEALSGPPLQEQLRDLTFVHDREDDVLTDSFGVVWTREGAEDLSPDPMASGGMWPQSTMEEVREAQRLADAGDPNYTWQVVSTSADRMEFITRFLQEELGWEEFDVSDFPGLYAGVPQDGLWELLAVRCAPGQTNPLYPDDPQGRGCAPTIDEHRYETVMINAEPPVRVDDPSAIWVVTRWRMLQPTDVQVTGTHYRDINGAVFRRQVRQMEPPSDAEVTALVEAFLQARVDGEGAEEYLSPADSQVDLLYATTSGDSYERSEFELVRGPVWPGGWREFTVRLFTADGSTVKQTFLVERDDDGRLALVYTALDPFDDVLTTENGGALAEPYEFLDGEVTFAAAPPWDYYIGGWGFGPTMTTLQLDDPDRQRFDQLLAVVADPLPVEDGCRQGPAPADAEALARSIRSDPDLEATAPVAVSVGGIDAVRMDVTAAPGASVCEKYPAPLVLTPGEGSGVNLEQGSRTRLYLLDAPEGSSFRILAISINAPEPDFGHVIAAAAPVLDSFEFHAP